MFMLLLLCITFTGSLELHLTRSCTTFEASTFNITVLREIEHLSFFNLIFLHAAETV